MFANFFVFIFRKTPMLNLNIILEISRATPFWKKNIYMLHNFCMKENVIQKLSAKKLCLFMQFEL